MPYANTGENWEWVQDTIGKARWLGYVDWDQIRDQKNDAPDVWEWTPPVPTPGVKVDFEVYLPNAEDLAPKARIDGFVGSQPYHLVMVGEKSSLRDVLGPIAREHGADLYLPAGDISNTLVHRMARSGVTDERPMVVLYFADSDPSGWHMPIICARKLQAFQATLFPELDFRVYRAGLTPDQVRGYNAAGYNLPSTPLKAKEKRADDWRNATGTEQTEIDAIATLRPDLLESLARDAIAPFYDLTLGSRVSEARQAWLTAAQARIDEQDDTDLDELRADAARALEAHAAEIEALMDDVRVDPDRFDLPEPVIPEAEVDEYSQPEALCDSRWELSEQIERLIESKNYGW